MADDAPLFGVIDVGTNTCHLLIASYREGEPVRVAFRERRFVKLAEKGIDVIRPEAMERGLAAIRHYHALLPAYKVSSTRIIGTAALRTAANGPQFIREVLDSTGLRIETVSGDEEARLIHLGVSLAVPFGEPYRLIVDIGGGSVECILANRDGVAWAESFPIGLGVLFHRFHRHDPMLDRDWEDMRGWLDAILEPLDEALKRFPPQDLVGASGTFDVLADMLDSTHLSPTSSRYGLAALKDYRKKLLPSTTSERLLMADVPDDRADMFVLALFLAEHLAERAGLSTITSSTYAMKEGILREMAEAMR